MHSPSGKGRRAIREASWALLWLLAAPLVFWAGSSARGALQAFTNLSPNQAEWLPRLLTVLAYGLPMACVGMSARFALKTLGAAGSGTTARAKDEADWIDRLSWLQFEQLVESHFANRGLRIALLRGVSGLQGRLAAIDGAGVVVLIHFSEWKVTELEYEVVKRLVDDMAARSAGAGVLLTFGHLTRAASALASKNNIEVVNGEKLTRMLRSSGWDSSRFRESGSGTSSGFGNSRTSDSTKNQ